MVFIENFKDGDAINGIYFCKTKNKALTRNGSDYYNVNLQDKTGTIDGKIWSITSPSIKDFDAGDFVRIVAEVGVYREVKQLTITSIDKAAQGEYNPADYYVASSRNLDEMKKELSDYIVSIKKPYYKELLKKIFGDEKFYNEFVVHTGAKQVHHSFVSGLLEHTLSVAKLCDSACDNYEMLDRDLLITSALCHDIGKVYEIESGISYEITREGTLIGHVIKSYEIVNSKIKEIENFPEKSAEDLLHCILAHHGKLEFGSPKAPVLIEALVLSSNDNLDAKMETMKEELIKLSQKGQNATASAYNKYLDGGYVVETSKE